MPLEQPYMPPGYTHRHLLEAGGRGRFLVAGEVAQLRPHRPRLLRKLGSLLFVAFLIGAALTILGALA